MSGSILSDSSCDVSVSFSASESVSQVDTDSGELEHELTEPVLVLSTGDSRRESEEETVDSSWLRLCLCTRLTTEEQLLTGSGSACS